ncbi:MAG: hypothetical protein H8E47_01270 [Anaerolineales bacterium]|nr:hypothetical protein [Anaerolineales bacterium]
MSIAQQTTPILEYADRLFTPLVREGIFRSYGEILKSLLLDYIDRQIALYEGQARAFETKHGMTFEEYTRNLRRRASIAEEDEWMNWEEALVFLRKCNKIKRQIADAAS